MKRLLQFCAAFAGVALLASGYVQSAGVTPGSGSNFSEGKEYIRLSAPQPTSTGDKIEVVELFWYGCPHCYQLEPKLHDWIEKQPEDVEFVRMPAILSPRWELLGRAYYASELLGELDKTHIALFRALHQKNQRIMDEQALVKFMSEQGVDEKAFRDAFRSFAVAAKINRARQMTQRYAINGVPNMIINGKFRTSATEAGNQEKMLEVVDYLIAKERDAASADAAPPPPSNISVQ